VSSFPAWYFIRKLNKCGVSQLPWVFVYSRSCNSLGICTLLAVKLPQQSSGVYSQLWLRSKAMASQDPCTVLRVLGLANSIVPLTSWRKKLMKQVPHSLYQTLYSAGVTKAHPLLTSDLVIQEHRGSWRQHLEAHGRALRRWFWVTWVAWRFARLRLRAVCIGVALPRTWKVYHGRHPDPI